MKEVRHLLLICCDRRENWPSAWFTSLGHRLVTDQDSNPNVFTPDPMWKFLCPSRSFQLHWPNLRSRAFHPPPAAKATDGTACYPRTADPMPLWIYSPENLEHSSQLWALLQTLPAASLETGAPSSVSLFIRVSEPAGVPHCPRYQQASALLYSTVKSLDASP